MSIRRLDRDVIGKLGSDIYERQLQSKLIELAFDQFVAIDVEKADYEIACQTRRSLSLKSGIAPRLSQGKW